jgi:hypothetical protein
MCQETINNEVVTYFWICITRRINTEITQEKLTESFVEGYKNRTVMGEHPVWE